MTYIHISIEPSDNDCDLLMLARLWSYRAIACLSLERIQRPADEPHSQRVPSLQLVMDQQSNFVNIYHHHHHHHLFAHHHHHHIYLLKIVDVNKAITNRQ